MSSIYEPAEDSYLLTGVLEKEIPKLLKKNPELKFLEIGCGSGIILESSLNSGIELKNIFSVDINESAVEHCQELGFNCIYSDLFDNVGGKYDLIVFNPPYLPQDSREPADSQLATTGGIKGSEVVNEFLKQAKNYLNSNGKIFLLTSSLTKKIDWQGFDKKLLGEEKLFMEKLFVWELRE